MTNDVELFFFHVFIDRLYIFFVKMSIQVFCPFSFGFFVIFFLKLFLYSRCESLLDIWFSGIFLWLFIFLMLSFDVQKF